MKCKKCKNEVKKEWNFCPHCGSKLGREMKMNRDLIKNMNSIFKKFFSQMNEDTPGEMNLSIKMPRGKKVNVKRGKRRKKGKKKVNLKEESPKEPEEVEEPEAEVKDRGGKKVIEMELEDVKSSEKIKIRKFGDSIEVRARAGDKIYFKAIPIAKNFDIVDREFIDNKLKITLSAVGNR